MSKDWKPAPSDWMMSALRPKRSRALTLCECARCCQDRPCDSVLAGAQCEMKRCECRNGMPRELNFDRE